MLWQRISTKMADFQVKRKQIEDKFKINTLTEHQIEAINALRQGQDVFVGTKTGSGKSVIYECSPIALKSTGVTTVLAPLTSIMLEQVDRLNRLGFRSIHITSNTNIEAVKYGYYSFIFGSPEMLVGESKWREVFRSPVFTAKHQLIVVDEAHTVIQWGLEHHQEEPFREWFSHIGELRSLCIGVPVLALTATASPTHRRLIMKNLNFKKPYCVVVDSPDRTNIKISVHKVKNNTDLESIFGWLIEGLHNEKQDFPRHLIFCNSIKDGSSIYLIFLKNLGKTDLFNMYHSKTTEVTKEKIRKDMGDIKGYIRVLICTNAAGMGVNYQSLNNIIHYGPPRELDTLVQQIGRAGRDGSNSNELIVYKSNQLKKVDDDILKVLKTTDQCRRKLITQAYMQRHTEICKHLCCDMCESSCNCGNDICPAQHPAKEFFTETTEVAKDEMIREVTKAEELEIRQRLTTLKESVTEGTISIVHIDFMSGFSVDEIVEKVPYLFTTQDVIDKTTVSSNLLAEKIMAVVNEIFGDIQLYDCVEDMEAGSDIE